MKCGDTCLHNISKLNSGLSVKLLQLPLQRSGKALEENLEGACSIYLQKSFILVRRIYWIFRLLRGGLHYERTWLSHQAIPYHAKPSQPCLGLTRRGERARARGGGGGCNGSVGVWWQWTRAKTSTGRAKGATLRKHAYSLANHHAAT